MGKVKGKQAGRFAPGVSGNPGGRPRLVKELLGDFRAETPGSLAVAVEIRDNEKLNAGVRLEAAKFIASYGLGKPLNVDPKSDEDDNAQSRPLTGYTHEQLLEIVQAARAPAEGH